MTEKKTYVPKCNAKKIEFKNGGSLIKISLNAAEFHRFSERHVNEKGYINLCVSERQSPDQYGNTHCVWLDTWKPTRPAQPRQESYDAPGTPPADDVNDDIPF